MSRKSVIQLVPAPISRGNASDLRYRLLMAALGSSEEVNPLLVAPDAADGAVEAPETVAASPAHANQAIPGAEPHAVEQLAVAEHEEQAAPPSLVRPPAPSPATPHKTATEAPAAAGGTPVPRAPKRR
jgi:hypothetical protein